MGKFLKPVWHWRCEHCLHEWPVQRDEQGNDKKPALCAGCQRRTWFTGESEARVAPAIKPLRLKRSKDSVRVHFYGGRHALDCGCRQCQKRFRRGLPPKE